MRSWLRVRLDQCAEIVSGATPDTSEPSYWNGDICWATPKDLSELDSAYISDTLRKITRRGLESCSASVLPPESVLFSSRAPIGHVAINTVPMATNQGFKSFVPDRKRLDAKYLYHWLRKNRPYLESLGNGATFKEVSKAVVSRIEIPLPPLPEQRRIAEILDKADALRAKRRAALAQLETLTQSIFLDMFGDPATNPKGWQWNRLGDVSDFFAGSTLPEGKTFTGQRKGYFLLKVSDMNLPGNDVYLKTCQQWSEVPGAASCTCPENSVVIPKRGGAIGTNKKRITTRPSVLDPNLMAIAPRPGQIELQFLYAWLLHLDLTSITSGSSVPQLNKRDLDPLSIAVPPFDLQQEFARHVAEVQKIVDSQKAAESHLEHLFSALQHRAFRGEL